MNSRNFVVDAAASDIYSDSQTTELTASASSGRMSHKSHNRENLIRDELYKLRLQLINQKLKNNENVTVPYYYNQEQRQPQQQQPPYYSQNLDKNSNENSNYERLNQELEKAKKNYDKMKEKLKFQELERKITSQQQQQQQPPNSTNDKFGQYMEMMMIQQTQTQNMILNHVMLSSHNSSKPYHLPYHQEYNPIIVPPPPPPQPLYFPPISPYLYKPKTPPLTANPLYRYEKPTMQQPSSSSPALYFKHKDIDYPYPGNEAQISMRRLALAGLFCAILKANFEEQHLFLNDRFLFEIKIKEIITAIQAVYLNVDGEIYSLFQKILKDDSVDLRMLVTRNGTSKELTYVEEELNYFIQNLVLRICEIMPVSGTLGCEINSLLCEFVQTNNSFPSGYFYHEELQLFQLDSNGTLHSVGLIESQVLLIGIFFIRALVNTVTLKPIEYGLTQELRLIGKENLRVVATLLTYIYRSLLADYLVQRFPNNFNQKMYVTAEFTEIREALLNDAEIEVMIKKLQKSIKYCKDVIANWAYTYITKLRPV